VLKKSPSFLVYIIGFRGWLLTYLFENNALTYYTVAIEELNRVTGINFGFGPHPLEEYQQRADIFIFQIILFVFSLKAIHYIFLKKDRIFLFLVNVLLIGVLLGGTEAVLQNDYFQKKYGLSNYIESDREINFYNQEHQNQFGFRDQERDPSKAKDVWRAVILGDSFVWGDGLKKTHDIWSRILEAKLIERYGNKVEVISWGKRGWSSHNVLKFRRSVHIAAQHLPWQQQASQQKWASPWLHHNF